MEVGGSRLTGMCGKNSASPMIRFIPRAPRQARNNLFGAGAKDACIQPGRRRPGIAAPERRFLSSRRTDNQATDKAAFPSTARGEDLPMLPPAHTAAHSSRAPWKWVAVLLIVLTARRSPVQAGGA